MPLNLIQGTYRVTRSVPDGDSVHFFPGNPAAFTILHLNAHLGSGGAAQMRFPFAGRALADVVRAADR